METPDGLTAGALARRGFGDSDRAAQLLRTVGLSPGPHDDIIAELGRSPDPDLALLGLARLLENEPEPDTLRTALHDDTDLRTRLIRVLGASAALTDHLVAHPGDWQQLCGPDAARVPSAAELRAGMMHTVGADPNATAPVAMVAGDDAAGPVHALHVAYRRRVLRLAGRDLTGRGELDNTAAELAELAAATLDAALAIARADHPEEAAQCRIAVIGMGKCGGRELNYVSDVDVVFVADPAGDTDEPTAMRAGARLASTMMCIPAETAGGGRLWEVDASLRPEGKNGPLVRTLAGHLSYYERWAKNWEFQALLKARPIAGDTELGASYAAAIAPMVWSSVNRPNFVEEVQGMRRRVEAHLPPDGADREIKLGPGGLRDIEFAVQLLQLVHGRSDPSLRSGNTLEALEALSGGGYVGRQDAAGLSAAYRFLRHVEHLLQLHRLRRTHVLPEIGSEDGAAQLRRLGRAMGFTAEPVGELVAEWRRVATEVRRLHEKLFYRPLLHAVARLPSEEARLSPEQAGDRLQALGFDDPAGALRHLEALTSGVSRRAAIQRTILPVMLGWMADAPRPDTGLLGFRKVSEELGTTPWYLRLLRDDIRVAERMAWLLGTSPYVTELLLRAPEAVATLANDDDLARRPTPVLTAEVDAALRRHGSAENAVAAVRALRRRELLRTGAADLLGVADIDEVGTALTTVAAVTIDAALRTARERVVEESGVAPRTRMCVVAMGRFGGNELSYASDADVMFVHEPVPGTDLATASGEANAVVRELRRLLEMPGADPSLAMDANLRPEGRSGPLVRSLESYATYYRRWSATWESQALLRATPVAGDTDLGARFTELIDPIRYPQGGVSESAVREIRRLKARMEAERLPRGADPTLHTKLGRGGLSDVEWVVQLVQLRHAHRVPELRTTGTLEALRVAEAEGLVAAEDAEVLRAAWRLAARVRGAIMLVRGKAGDSVPTDLRERAALAGALGFHGDDEGDGASELLLQEYRRATRRARAVMERLFYDD